MWVFSFVVCEVVWFFFCAAAIVEGFLPCGFLSCGFLCFEPAYVSGSDFSAEITPLSNGTPPVKPGGGTLLQT